MIGVNYHMTCLFLSLDPARAEEAGLIEDENQEDYTNTNKYI